MYMQRLNTEPQVQEDYLKQSYQSLPDANHSARNHFSH